MKKIILALGLSLSSIFAIDLGILTISPEVGATLSYSKVKGEIEDKSTSFNNDNTFSPGAYARLWLGVAGFMIAPHVKYDYLRSSFVNSKESIHNIQYGGVLGYRIPFIKLTPFVGASYSTFKGGFISGSSIKETYAINFGVRWEVPLFSLLVIGFEGSWQKPDLKIPASSGKHHAEMLNLGGTIGFAF
ncbi:hypothetical protein [Helicobacter pametensis]|uniref:hypothetical protein n=1 Tax=Helicobacter pametensis TaxID=95149 RepID=UPI00048520BF|nr:hypothetical protein [Helicobacter pametensis]